MKLAINGFGRIGIPVFRRILDKHPNIEVVAINDLTDAPTLAHLLKYDSNYGRYDKSVIAEHDSLVVDGKTIKIIAEKDPANLPWKDLGVDVVLECAGLFTKYDDAKKHIRAGAKKVILSAPSDSLEIPTYLLGVNADKYQGENIISMGSCTTNSLAPIVKIINDNYGIESGFMTTVHSYTNDQRILDLPHKDLRRARAAGQNIIPTTTGAAKAISLVIPDLADRFDGYSLRVPTPTVSIVDFVAELRTGASTEDLRNVLKKAARTHLKGIMHCEDAGLVSSDFKGDAHSSIIDIEFTQVLRDNMAKVVA